MTGVIALGALFKALILVHVIAGAIGLASFWVPVLSRKGGARHRLLGRIFAYALLVAGGLAVAMSLITLTIPLETHPKLSDANLIRGLFGWLMLYLGTLTVAMSWFGIQCIRNKRDHFANRHWFNVALQVAAPIAATNCAYQGWKIGQIIMMAVAPVGFLAAALYLAFIFKRDPEPGEYVHQHFRALIGAGISVYTAFLAFGAVQLMPSHAFNPTMWSVPSIVGLSIVGYHEAKAALLRQRRSAKVE
jgi:NADH:ubiquinone oxidoreductase subunit 6 (subunit J)